MNWNEFWEKFPAKFKSDDFLRQVGKTFHGETISPQQLQAIIAEIILKTGLTSDDIVLDVCCGNGLLTSIIAKECSFVTGVDFSRPLIDIARGSFGRENIRYFCLSALDINPAILQLSAPYTKVYMYEALQHFREDQFPAVLDALLSVAAPNAVFLFASVPDIEKLWSFYDIQHKEEYIQRMNEGNDPLGTWWSKAYIAETCDLLGLRCSFLPQDPCLHTAHYRFDFVCGRKGQAG